MGIIGLANWSRGGVGRALIVGAAAGDHSVPGIGAGDDLLAVHHLSDDLVTNADLTSEFTVDGDNLINNGGGTSSAGDFLVVVWAKAR